MEIELAGRRALVSGSSQGIGPALEIDDEWRRYFEVNVLSAVRLIRTYLPGMIDRGRGRIMNIASDSAVVIPSTR
jgi:NAD(P)-dependent dehydrogenase (short-subunit alcohol dehydrogenase family)